jgi:hypothetical protein
MIVAILINPPIEQDGYYRDLNRVSIGKSLYPMLLVSPAWNQDAVWGVR